MNMSLYDKVVDIICDVTDIEEGQISRDSHIVNDLQIDSLSLVEILTQFENEFGITCDTSDFNGVYIIEDIVNTLEELGATVDSGSGSGGNSGESTNPDGDDNDNGTTVKKTFNLSQYCPTIGEIWDAIINASIWPSGTTAENFWSSLVGPDELYETLDAPYMYNGTYTTTDGFSCRHAICLGSIGTSNGKWIYNFNKITGSNWRSLCTTSWNNILLIPTRYCGTFPGKADNSELLCTYLPMDNSTIYPGYLYFPIVKLGSSNPCEYVSTVREYVSVNAGCPIIIFWQRIKVNGEEYIGPGCVLRFSSAQSTSPTISKKNLYDWLP